jgi:hypothetical protein
MYFPRNWEVGSALSKLRNFGGRGAWTPPSVRHWSRWPVAGPSEYWLCMYMCVCCVFVGLVNKRLWSFRVPQMSVITWPPARLAAPQQELLYEVRRKFWQSQVTLLLSAAINLGASISRQQVNTSIRQQERKSCHRRRDYFTLIAATPTIPPECHEFWPSEHWNPSKLCTSPLVPHREQIPSTLQR